jgi:hypothetical protein
VRLYLGGAEHPGWRKRLLANDVTKVAINYTALRSRLPKTKPWFLAEHFPPEVDVLLYWSPKDWTRPDRRDFTAAYCAFADEHADRLINAIAAPNGGPDWAIPMWDGRERAEEVMRRADDNVVALTSAQLGDRRAKAVMASIKNLHGQLLGVGVSDLQQMQGLTAATSSSWISATRYGETVLWDGHRLRRFPAARKDEVRRRYRTAIERAGVDHEAVLADDKESVIALTLWSWQQMEASMVVRNIRRVAPADDEYDDVVDLSTRPVEEVVGRNVDEGAGGVDRSLAAPGLPAVIEQRERVTIPVLSSITKEVVDEHGDVTSTDMVVMRTDGLRVCDSCAVADKCPAFKPQHECQFDIPVEVRTKDQLMNMLNGLLEMQGQRILFMRFAEELEGGYADPNLSQEMERFVAMTERVKAISDNRDFINIQVEAKAGGGVLSRLFGDHIGEQARALPSGGTSAEQTNQFLADQLGVVDAEIVQE